MIRIFTIFSFVIFSGVCYAQEEKPISHSLYHQYEGDFRFQDGTYITGGPMGEIVGSVLYLDPVSSSIGGLFIPDSPTIFKSAFPPGSKTKIEYVINQDEKVEGLWWTNEIGERKFAQKVLAPAVKQVMFKNGNITLAGELHLPEGEGPFPAIINVHGSGRQDRHSGPWDSFFTRYGIAVLSYDKRGVAESTGKYETAGYEDLASDVLAGVEFLKSKDFINDKQIGIHGSSEGGWVGSIAVANTDDIAFFLVRAGSGVSGFETYMHEVKNELKAKDLTKQEWVQAVKLERQFYELAISDVSLDFINSYLLNARTKYSWFERAFNDWNSLSRDYRVKLRKTGPMDPAKSLRQIRTPLLWFLADNDMNVPYHLSKPRIKMALQEAGNEDFQIITLEGANHAFLIKKEDGNYRYVTGYWDKMASWLKERGLTTSK